MLNVIYDWFYHNAAAIIISSLISLQISRMYYKKGNRDELLMTIIFPTVQLINKRYSKKHYEQLYNIKSNYAIRYLSKKERKAFMLLIEQYKEICGYEKTTADTDCILSYYMYKLEKEGINTKPCPLYDEEGDVVAYDYPPDYNYLANYINKLVCTMEFTVEPNEFRKSIIDAFNKYAKEFYTDKNIEWFTDYNVEEVINKSKIALQWNEKFKVMEERKKQFMDLSISKKVNQILNEK